MKTEIAFILDRSGSMEHIRQPTIDSFNTFLTDQKNTPGETNISLIFFSTETNYRYNSIPISEAKPLDRETYVPNGSTALLDAIGQTIDHLGENLAALPETERPGHVSIAILTDGEENSSRHYNWLQISDRIKHQTDVYSWEFLFLGAGQDTIATAGRMGIHFSSTASFLADKHGIEASISSVSKKMRGSKAVKFGYASVEETNDHYKSMGEILEEEDQKIRNQNKS